MSGFKRKFPISEIEYASRDAENRRKRRTADDWRSLQGRGSQGAQVDSTASSANWIAQESQVASQKLLPSLPSQQAYTGGILNKVHQATPYCLRVSQLPAQSGENYLTSYRNMIPADYVESSIAFSHLPSQSGGDHLTSYENMIPADYIESSIAFFHLSSQSGGDHLTSYEDMIPTDYVESSIAFSHLPSQSGEDYLTFYEDVILADYIRPVMTFTNISTDTIFSYRPDTLS